MSTNILIVEDDETHAEIIRRGFEANNFKFELAIVKSLAEARAYIKKTTPSLVISDLNLPDGEGSELIPLKDQKPTFPVVMMTGYGTEQIAADLIKKGAMDYIVKSDESLTNLFHISQTVLLAWKYLQERIATEQKLVENEERLQFVLQGADAGTWDWNTQTNHVVFDERLVRMLGYTLDEFEPNLSSYENLIHPEDASDSKRLLNDHLQGRSHLFEAEYRMRHKSGHWIWIMNRGKVVKWDNEGKPLRACGTHLNITVHKQTEQQVQKLSQVTQQIPISVLITDAEGNIEFGNQALVELSGYSEDEILGQNPRMFKSGESPDSYYELLWKTIANGKEWRGVFHNKKKSGELYWESVLIFPLKDVNGKVSNFIGLKEDITEKKQLESTLIDHERLIRSVINNLNDGLIIANVDGNIQLFNHGAEKIFGYSAEEVMDKPVEILMDDSYKEKHAIGFARFQKTHKILSDNASMEVVGKNKDGTAIPIELTLTQMEQRGELLVVGTIRDISERKEAEMKILAERDLSKLYLETAATAIAILDKDGTLVTINKMACDLLGYEKEEILGGNWFDLFLCERERETVGKVFQKILAGEISSVNYYINTLVTKSGKDKVVEFFNNEFKDANNKTTGVIFSFNDITEKIATEERLKNAQKQVIAAQKLAGVGELAAGVSHEVLNPVNIISVHTQMLQRKTKDDANIQNFCSKVRNEIDRIQKIMSSLLVFSRSGNSELQKGTLRTTIESVLTLVEEEYKLDNIKIIKKWCGQPREIQFDTDKIRQVYLNLFNNAKHAMPDGGTITIGCRPASNKDYHQFTFIDTGTGMSEEVRLKIFEPFFTTKPEGEGTGMGMSVIHGIVQEHGGKIRVESEEGKGTTFTISLPVAK